MATVTAAAGTGGSASAVGDPREQELLVRLNSVRVGIWITVIVSLGCEAYALATWGEPNRGLIVLVSTLGLLSAPLVRLLPIERIVRSDKRELFFISWSAADIAFIAACAALDGGSESPYALLLVLPFLFGSLFYPLWSTMLIGLLAVASYVAVAVGVGGGFAHSVFGSFTLVCVALLGSWEARNQGRRRISLAKVAEALLTSEETSRTQALQQREVARLGQIALGGASIEQVQDEAVAMVSRVLSVDISAVLRGISDRDEFQIAAQRGMPEEVWRSARIRGGHNSHTGYCVETRTPVIVDDWAHETRFRQSEVLREAGVTSGVTVPVMVEGEAWGVLGAQTRHHRDFSAGDVSFIQALAHVLANAIERRTAEDRTRHDALHDPLTGLPNRNLFLDRLEHGLSQAHRHRSSIAVLFLDLDQFKLVNDSLGHAAGDELLAAVAPRIQSVLRPEDTVARFGGDEFAILVEDVSNERDATRVAERITQALTRPFVLRQREHFVSASIGISLSTGGGAPEALIRDADAALYRAKDHGRGGYEIFDEVMRSRVIEHMETENDLRRALQRRELELHFQPIVSLADGSTVMLEALLRWQHPERGLLTAPAFIPVAEESLLIVPIGRWVIDEACCAAASWQALHPDRRPIGVSVNLSARELADPHLLRCIRDAIDSSGIDPSTLRLELTETTLLEEAETPEVTLRSLRDLGVRLILDDFGTGFSSLGYLQRLPLAGIKLDRAFVEHLGEGGSDATIVAAVTQMASALGLEVCAEGVETAEQLAAVQELGCTHAQGFRFGMPSPAVEIETRLRADPTRADQPA